MDSNLLTPSNPVFAGYAFYSCVLILKTMCMSYLTGVQRFRKKAFVNVEDAIAAGVDVKVDDQDVERCRRAHLNDLENITMFLITGIIYVLTDPNIVFALMLFRIYAVARILHTIVYAVVVVRQPARAICFNIGVFCNFIMIFSIFSSCVQL
ncbi:microsomal glutathione S-transferase 1 [Halyomorpha halys]|uniref:microsomal glutathione S-transferase 1 n=1 Tax=Halyomorpha halys TaxID=286706 RepID=UPI0006D4EEC9|nr:microsomal glutathione S-transferase 1-like [Halyomorpha halys]